MKNFFEKGRLIAVIAIASILSIIPFYIMVIKGVYHWHSLQPQFVQGGIELCVAMILMCIGWAINKKRLFVPVIIISCIYLSVNGVVIPVMTALIYIIMLCYIGYSFSSVDKSDNGILKLIKAFIAGISIWGCGAIIFSLLGFGTINKLRIYTMGLFILACIIVVWRNREINVGLLVDRVFKYRNDSFIETASMIIIAGIVLALFAKTNTAQDYDSLWYGLRSQYVLVGQNSFYDDLGYFSFVYYYPKFFEFLLLPISNLGDYSFIPSANIVIFFMSLLVIYYSLQKNVKGMDRKTKFILLALIAAIPAFANISATAKGDILGFYLVLCAFVFIQEYIEFDKFESIIYAVLALALCTAVRLTYILWGGILFLWCVYICIKKGKRNNKIKKNDKILCLKENILTISASVITVAGIHYRTYKLTGYVIYPIAVSFFNKVFHNGHKYFLTQSNSITREMDFRSIMLRIYQFIFDPQALEHVIMLWTSNVLLITLLIWLLHKKKKIKIGYKILAVLYVLGILYYMVSMPNPDGNYFILPIIVVTIIICSGVQTENKTQSHFINLSLLISLLFLLPIMFISHSSWAWGTKAFTTELIVDNFETRESNQSMFEYNGVSEIVEEVKAYSVNDKVISSSDDTGLYFRFPCNLETYLEISLPSFSNANIGQYDKFKEVMGYLSVKALIVDKDDTSDFPNLVAEYVEEQGVEKVIEDQGAVCYVFR